jgi:hypothetical protein
MRKYVYKLLVNYDIICHFSGNFQIGYRAQYNLMNIFWGTGEGSQDSNPQSSAHSQVAERRSPLYWGCTVIICNAQSKFELKLALRTCSLFSICFFFDRFGVMPNHGS